MTRMMCCMTTPLIFLKYLAAIRISMSCIMEKFPCLTTLGFTVPVSERLEIDQVADKYITNKLLLELNTIKEKSNCQYTYQDVLNWICSLCGKENVTNKSLYLKVKSILLKIKTTVSKLKKSKQNSEHVENYLSLVIDTDTLLEIPHNSRIRKNNLIETSDTEKMRMSNLEILIRLENVQEVEEVEETLQLTEE